ncbi:hypothetical protein SASPL_129549 [Salvia splendens]|uniref:Protein kinase domain-containing protein n=1 Tax=Salvia splendens TaxID=180675 RepID=A0A8X8ZN30_SALSN|nr:receptor protein kinase-like protein ZAR1 [Salvia splendens]KAG6411467.1 hypothetical protein SASPL_129549 [Salvia splendens]
MPILKKNALFNLFYFSTLCISLSSSLNTDGLSLLALKSAISEDPNRALISWSELDATPCRWAGVACDDRGRRRVVAVSLPGKNLTGYIPSEIGALSCLAFLDLSHNFFSGPLPQQIAALQSLVHFDISSNNFNGSLLQGLSNLTNLQGTLNLSYNSFSGEIPASFGRFPVMVSLDLRCNNLSGKIPEVGSLLNQGPTAFSGNLDLCGFPLSTPCTAPEAKDPIFIGNPQKPEGNGGGGVVEGREINGKLVVVSVICGVSVVVGVVAVTAWVIRRRWNVVEEKLGKRENVELGGEEGKKGKFVVMDQGFGLELEDLLRASAYVLGKSRSGIVYRVVAGGRKGAAAAAAVVVAVRRLSEGDVAWSLREFEAEVEAIGKVRHPNVVRLRAYYYASDEKLLISDFISNGSLCNALHGAVGNTGPPLSWAARLRIIQETARGLMHIHECSPRKYVHGSLKSSKILLDDDLKPCISGFGLSRLIPTATKSAGAPSKKPSVPNMMCVAPEARGPGAKLNQKCDVYAFGILVMEILTGRPPDNDREEGLESLVRRVFREERPLSEIIDPALLHEARAKKQVVAAFHVSLNCTERDPELRPKMRAVSDSLDRIKLQ